MDGIYVESSVIVLCVHIQVLFGAGMSCSYLNVIIWLNATQFVLNAW